MAIRQHLWRSLAPALAALAIVAAATLWSDPNAAEQAARLPWTCLFPCGDQSLRDAVLNVLLFLPLGFTLRRLLPGRLALLVVIFTTVTIEFIQHHWLLGRDGSLRDILANSAGGAVGIWLSGSWPVLLRPTPVASRRLLAATGGLWLLMVSLTAALIEPSLPRSVYWGQWAPELGQFDIWRGTLLEATVNGVPLPRGRTDRSGELRELLLQDSVMVEARVVSGPPPRKFAPIASVFDSEQREIFALGQRRGALAFGIRTGLRALELGPAYVRLSDFPGSAPGDTTVVSGGVVRGAWVLTARHGTTVRETRIPMSPGLLWSALLPLIYVLGPTAQVISAIWLALTILPVGYYAAWTPRAGTLATLAALVAVVGLTAAALLPGLPPPSMVEHLGTLGGLATGWLLGRRVAAAAGRLA